MPRVTILFDAVASDAPDEADNRRQVAEVGAALKRLGYGVRELAVGPDLAALGREDAGSLGVAFNLVEGLAGAWFLYSAVAYFLAWRGVPTTGGTGDQLLILSNKLLTRRMLPRGGVQMPPLAGEPGAAARFIVKSVREHASLGLGPDSIVESDQIKRAIAERTARFGGVWFAESYIPGREFCVAGLERQHGPLIFPPSEILFDKVPRDYPQILDYASKWHEGSAEYGRTPRRLLDARAEPALHAKLIATSEALWQGLALRGYARFDYRFSNAGTLYVIDININPCLASDAGFMAAAGAAGLFYDATIAAIIEAARCGPPA